MLHLHYEFIRSIRLGDLELYIYCLPRITDYFFTFNRRNNARWLARYHDNLLKLSERHNRMFMMDSRKAALVLKEPKRIFQGFQLI